MSDGRKLYFMERRPNGVLVVEQARRQQSASVPSSGASTRATIRSHLHRLWQRG